MAGKKLTGKLDPHIFGPQQDQIDILLHSESSSPRGVFDLEASSPFLDFWKMLFFPREFFKTLYRLPVDVSAWIWIKAIGGATLAVWVKSFGVSRDFVSSLSQNLVAEFGQSFFSYFEYKSGLSHIAERLSAVALLYAQFNAVAAPFFLLSELVLGTGFLILGLRIVGVPWQKISFPKLLLLGIYLQFFQILSVVPLVGVPLAFCLKIAFGIFAVSWIFQISKWKSVEAYFILSYALAQMIAMLALVPLLIVYKIF